MKIADRYIGIGHPPYIIAEISANHNGSLDRAFETMKSAKECGADAVKIQTYTADTMTIDCEAPDFIVNGGIWDGFKLYDLYKEAETPFEWHSEIFDFAKKLGITVFSTPFDETAVDLLEDLNTPAYKIASFEIVDIPLIKYVAKTGKPMIMSTGMAHRIEVEEAVEAARDAGCKDLVLLHCVSSYPTPIENANIKRVPELSKNFRTLSGLSDHTLGITASIAATAIGASIIEKHFTLSRKDKGPDSEFSLEPDEFKQLCTAAKETWLALGKADLKNENIDASSRLYRRSIYVVRDLKKGDLITQENVRRIRPGHGLAPKYYDEILGKKVKQNISRGTPLRFEHIK